MGRTGPKGWTGQKGWTGPTGATLAGCRWNSGWAGLTAGLGLLQLGRAGLVSSCAGPLDLDWSAGSGLVRWVRIGLLPALPKRGVDPISRKRTETKRRRGVVRAVRRRRLARRGARVERELRGASGSEDEIGVGADGCGGSCGSEKTRAEDRSSSSWRSFVPELRGVRLRAEGRPSSSCRRSSRSVRSVLTDPCPSVLSRMQPKTMRSTLFGPGDRLAILLVCANM
ncbi:hypothetical protein CRG98_021028 [Punica granatum]|uniref:Uncharacterized protein n=1 Tax=Punica granatum TaxID=22663 RepID=A0A2I0JQJ9_PUNGR|nr:hypothetical protein CRG98_021028 [Punica granatum]